MEEVENEAEKEERLRQEKALFKQQMMMAQKPAKVAPEPLVAPATVSDEDESSYYSEGEIQTRIKLIGQKSYSAPYIIFSDCYEEPLGGSEDEESQRPPSKAYSESIL